jgi:hypothetical protein
MNETPTSVVHNHLHQNQHAATHPICRIHEESLLWKQHVTFLQQQNEFHLQIIEALKAEKLSMQKAIKELQKQVKALRKKA